MYHYHIRDLSIRGSSDYSPYRREWLPVSYFFSVLGKSKRWWPGGLILGGGALICVLIAGVALFGAIAIVVGLTSLGFVLDYLFSKYKIGQGKGGKGGGMWFFGGGGGSSGGGGFGGFGGGSSGGGGASGSW